MTNVTLQGGSCKGGRGRNWDGTASRTRQQALGMPWRTHQLSRLPSSGCCSRLPSPLALHSCHWQNVCLSLSFSLSLSLSSYWYCFACQITAKYAIHIDSDTHRHTDIQGASFSPLAISVNARVFFCQADWQQRILPGNAALPSQNHLLEWGTAPSLSLSFSSYICLSFSCPFRSCSRLPKPQLLKALSHLSALSALYL